MSHRVDFEDSAHLDDGGEVKIMAMFSGRHLQRYSGVIVEMWDRRKHGRQRRAFLTEFDDKERAALGRWYRKMYGWHMRTGHPQRVQMSMKSHDLIVRCANLMSCF